MRTITLLFGVILFFVAIGAVLFYLRPQSFSWLGWEEKHGLGREYIVVSQEGSPSIRVSNGRIVAQEQYEIAFPFSGRVEAVVATEGQIFAESGQPLIQLDKTEWLLQMKRVEAEYAAEQAMVNKLQEGARFEELLIVEQRKQSFESGLKGSKKEVLDAIANAYVLADDAVRNKSDGIFTNPESDPQLTFTPSDAMLEAAIESERVAMKRRLDNWQDDVHDMKSSGNISSYLTRARSKLKETREYLDTVALAVNALTAGAISQDTIDSWKDALAAARSNVAEATITLGVAESAYKVAHRDFSVAQSELDLKLAGTARQDIEAALSAAVAARSQMDIIAEKLKQTTLTTPIGNLVLKQLRVKQGEYVEAGAPVALLVNPGFEIEVDVPEEKIAGVHVGNHVIMRLNAYPYEDITGSVKEIKAQEIEKDGGVYFRVRASIDVVADKIRTGMTGDVIVGTDGNKGAVIRIPESVMHESHGRRFVTISKNGAPLVVTIETGILKDNQVEILSGLRVGDTILFETR